MEVIIHKQRAEAVLVPKRSYGNSGALRQAWKRTIEGVLVEITQCYPIQPGIFRLTPVKKTDTVQM